MNGTEVAHLFFDAIGAGDWTTVSRLCTEDAVIWHNYDQRDTAFRVLAKALAIIRARVEGFGYAQQTYAAVPDGAVV